VYAKLVRFSINRFSPFSLTTTTDPSIQLKKKTKLTRYLNRLKNVGETQRDDPFWKELLLWLLLLEPVPCLMILSRNMQWHREVRDFPRHITHSITNIHTNSKMKRVTTRSLEWKGRKVKMILTMTPKGMILREEGC